MGKFFKKTILIDLDGVLNIYTGNYQADFIPPVKEGATEFLENLSKTYELKLFTTRNKNLATKWLKDNKLEKFFVDITNIKEPAWLYIDDRCINFDGNYEHLKNSIETYIPWFKNK